MICWMSQWCRPAPRSRRLNLSSSFRPVQSKLRDEAGVSRDATPGRKSSPGQDARKSQWAVPSSVPGGRSQPGNGFISRPSCVRTGAAESREAAHLGERASSRVTGERNRRFFKSEAPHDWPSTLSTASFATLAAPGRPSSLGSGLPGSSAAPGPVVHRHRGRRTYQKTVTGPFGRRCTRHRQRIHRLVGRPSGQPEHRAPSPTRRTEARGGPPGGGTRAPHVLAPPGRRQVP